MVNRGGESYETGKFVASAIGWPIVGEDPGDIVICDAGSAMVGFGFKVSRQHMESGKCCSRRFLEEALTDVNPAEEMVLVPADFGAAVPRAARNFLRPDAEVARAVTKAKEGQPQLSFFDINGNLTTLTRPNQRGLPGAYGNKVKQLLRARGMTVSGRGKPNNPASLIGITFLVADIPTSTKFYREVLGLRALRRERDRVAFDAGALILRTQAEREVGLVKSHSQRGLLTDQVIWYTPDITAEVANLKGRGVDFPNGIEETISSGFVAYFPDPDGHNLWLWQPPPQYVPEMPINFFPVLNRILSEHRKGR
jgi:catechol 2,3-dioxygenase-like lactoylglutathione lyase family enzyme